MSWYPPLERLGCSPIHCGRAMCESWAYAGWTNSERRQRCTWLCLQCGLEVPRQVRV